MKLAVLQARAEPLDAERNLGLIDQAAARASAQGAELLLTPELFAFGYAPARIRREVTAEQVAQSLEAAAAIARAHRIGVLISLPGPESADARGITSTLLSPSGEQLAHYQKVQLFGAEEKAAFVPGDQPPPVVEYAGLQVGLLICYDVEFPEMARASAAAGAELLLVPTALAGDVPSVPGTIIPARSVENRMTVAYANHVGEEEGLEFDGRSIVAGPGGEVIGELGAEPGLLLVEVGARPTPGDEGPWYLEDRRTGLHRQWL